jgi:hypothetical protein
MTNTAPKLYGKAERKYLMYEKALQRLPRRP